MVSKAYETLPESFDNLVPVAQLKAELAKLQNDTQELHERASRIYHSAVAYQAGWPTTLLTVIRHLDMDLDFLFAEVSTLLGQQPRK